jgi:hypothetical protein
MRGAQGSQSSLCALSGPPILITACVCRIWSSSCSSSSLVESSTVALSGCSLVAMSKAWTSSMNHPR